MLPAERLYAVADAEGGEVTRLERGKGATKAHVHEREERP